MTSLPVSEIIPVQRHPLYPATDNLEALTSKYAFYHDMVQPGQYWRVVEDMHRRYGILLPLSRDRQTLTSLKDLW